MKKHFLLILLVLLLTACAQGSASPPTQTPDAASGSTVVPATDIPASPTPLPTEIPPSPVPPTATALPPTTTPAPVPLDVATVGQFRITATFGQGELLRSLAFSPDGAALVTAGGNTEDFDVRVWDVAGGELLQTLSAHTGIVWSVVFSPNGQLLVTTSADGTANIWDWRNGRLMKTLEFPGQVSSAAFSPDGEFLAIGGTETFPDAAIWVYNVSTWTQTMKLAEFWNIPSIVYTPDGTVLVGGGTSRNARIWQANSGVENAILYHSGQVTSLAMSPDGSTIAASLCVTAGDSGTCRLSEIWFWDTASGERGETISDINDWVEQVAYSIDGTLLIVGMRNGTLNTYAASNNQLVLRLGSIGGNGIFALSSDGSLLATAKRDGQIDLWQVVP